MPHNSPAPCVVIDTNIVLDMLVFDDPYGNALLKTLQAGAYVWIATLPMRAELERVLNYPNIVKRRAYYKLESTAILAQFDALVQLREPAAKAPYTCKDTDDQCYIDLAMAHRAVLLSKDKAVLVMRKRLGKHGVLVASPLATSNTVIDKAFFTHFHGVI